MNICICGGGNIAHAFACDLYDECININILTRQPNLWQKNISGMADNMLVSSHINNLSNNPEILSDADIIIISVPTSIHYEYIRFIYKYINKNSIILVTPTLGGTYFLFTHFFPDNQIVFLQRTPFVSRIVQYGNMVNYSKKKSLDIFFSNFKTDESRRLISRLLSIPLHELDNFWYLVMSNSNPVIHIARIYEIFSQNYPLHHNPLFYAEWGDVASYISLSLDKEIQSIFSHMGLENFKSLKKHYEINNSSEFTYKMNNISSLKHIPSPMINHNSYYYFDFNSRYFTEDLPYGTCFTRFIASILNIDMPKTDMVIDKIQDFLNTKFIDNRGFILKNWIEHIGYNPFSLSCFNESIIQYSKSFCYNYPCHGEFFVGGVDNSANVFFSYYRKVI